MWDIVASNLQTGGDETTAVGPRRDEGSALFRVDTQASFSSSAAVQTVPMLTGASARKSVAAGIDTSVYIFDVGCSKDPIVIELDCVVEHVLWSDDESFLAVADRKGRLHFVDVVNERVLFTQNLGVVPSRPGSRVFVAMVQCAATDDVSHLLLLSATGRSFLFSNLNFTALRDAITAGDMADVAALKTAINLVQTDVSSVHKQLHGALLTMTGHQLSMIIFGDGLSVWVQHGDRWAVAQHIVMLFRGYLVMDIALAGNQRHLLVLDSHHILSLWHIPEFVMVKRFTHLAPVHTILLLPAPEESTSASEAPRAQSIVATLALPGPSNGRRELAILSLFAAETIFSLEISAVCRVLEGVDPECLHILDSSSMAAPLNLAALCIFVRCLTPTLPTNRFYHLLHKQRFSEAADFARVFGLDVELVDRVRIATLLDNADKDPHTSSLAALTAALDVIADLLFVVDSCLNASFMTLSDTQAMLEYGIARLVAPVNLPASKPAQDEGETERLRLRTQLWGAMKRLGTFHLASVASGACFQAAQWHHFKNADLLREVTSSLVNGRVATAALIWTRHMREYDLPADVPAILAALPASLPLAVFLNWLESAVLPLVRPEHHITVLRWADDRARVLELTDRDAWPRNALSVLQAVEPIAVLYTNRPVTAPAHVADIATPREFVDLVCGGHHAVALQPSLSRHQSPQQLRNHIETTDSDAVLLKVAAALETLRSALVDLEFLQTDLELELSVDEYAHETPSSIVARLLERALVPDVVATVISNEVRPYLRRHGLAHDETCLLVYLQDLLHGGLSFSVGSAASFRAVVDVGDSSWEQKALAVISVLTNMDVRVEATLELLRRASVPISPGLAALMASALTWSHASGPELREQARLVSLKAMLLPYGITSHNMTDESLARGLVRHLLSRTDIPSALSDALQIVAAYHHLSALEAYVFRLQILLQQGSLESSLALFVTLSPALQRHCAQDLVLWVFDTLSDLGPAVSAGPLVGTAWSEVVELHCHLQIMVHCLQRILTQASSASLSGACDRVLYAESFDTVADVPLEQIQQWHAQMSAIVQLMHDYGLVIPAEELALPQRQRHWLHELVSRELRETIDGGLTVVQAAHLASHDTCRGQRHNSQQHSDTRGPKNRAQIVLRGAVLLGLTPYALADDLSQRCAALNSSVQCHTLALEVALLLQAQDPGPDSAAVLAHLSSALAVHTADTLKNSGCHAVSGRNADAVVRACHTLAQQALHACAPRHVCDTLDLMRGLELAVEVFRQCDTGDYSTALGVIRTSLCVLPLDGADVRHRVTPVGLGCAHFREDGLVLDSHVALPMALRFAATLVHLSASTEVDCAPLYRQQRVVGRSSVVGVSAIAVLSQAANEIFQFLTLNSHTQLSYSFSVHALVTCAQHAAVNSAHTNVVQHFNAVLPKAAGVLIGASSSLLAKVFAAPACDRALALACMMSLPKPDAFQRFHAALGAARRDPARLVDLTLVAQGFGLCWDDGALKSESRAMHGNAVWLLRLANLGLSVEAAVFNRDPKAELMQLLPTLVHKWLRQLPELLKLCDSFALDRQVVLLAFADTAVVQSFAAGLEVAAALLPDSTALGPVLMAALERVHPCDYDRLDWIASLVLRYGTPVNRVTAERARLVLQLLFRYVRQASPGPYERSCMLGGEDTVDTTSPTHHERQRAFLTRLPFHALMFGDPMRILAPELSLASIAALRPLAVLLGLSSDELHTMLVHSVLATGAASPSLAASFAALEPVLSMINDAEMAVLAGKLVADDSHRPDDKLAALTWALARARQWLLELPPGSPSRDKASKMEVRLEDTRRRVHTELDLQHAGCTLPSVLAALGDPAGLIVVLYREAATAFSVNNCGTDVVELKAGRSLALVHALCLTIADRYDLDAEQLRRSVTQDWLTTADAGVVPTSIPSHTAVSGAAESGPPGVVVRTPMSLFAALEAPLPTHLQTTTAVSAPDLAATSPTAMTALLNFDENMRRAVALLKLGDRTTTVAFLLRFALDSEDSDTLTAASRLRAFRALFCIAPCAFITRVAHCSMPELHEQLLSRCYVLRLASLKIVYSPADFVRLNKEGLVRGLWRNHRHVPEAVVLLVDLLIDFSLCDMTLWDQALQALQQHSLAADIARVLAVIAGRPALWAVPSLGRLHAAAVAHLLRSIALADARAPRRVLAQRVCALVIWAPFVVQEDVAQTAQALLRAGEACSALLCVLAIPEDGVRREKAAAVLASNDTSAIVVLDQAADILSPLIPCVRNFVFDYVASTSRYALLFDTPHYDALVAHVVAHAGSEGVAHMLDATVRAGRLSSAATLVRHYALSTGTGIGTNAAAWNTLAPSRPSAGGADISPRDDDERLRQPLHAACVALNFATAAQLLLA